MNTVLSASEGNRLIKEKLMEHQVFIASKLGAVEQGIVTRYMYDENYSEVRHIASFNAGIVPDTNEMLDFFASEYIRAIYSINILGVWHRAEEGNIISNFCRKKVILSESRCLEPFYHSDPWSSVLKGMDVLVIHPFEDSIKEQYKKRLKIFQNPEVLPPFNLMILKSEQTHRGGMGNDKPFDVSLEIMKEKILSFNFDVALVGCGAYGLLLAEFIKVEKQRPVIHIGGGLQILFGIKGKRWDEHEDISKLYNEHWIRPQKSEHPRNINTIVDGGCYW